jgi:hypothetical protein
VQRRARKVAIVEVGGRMAGGANTTDSAEPARVRIYFILEGVMSSVVVTPYRGGDRWWGNPHCRSTAVGWVVRRGVPGNLLEKARFVLWQV